MQVTISENKQAYRFTNTSMSLITQLLEMKMEKSSHNRTLDSYTIAKGQNKVKPVGMNSSGVSGTIAQFMKISKWLLHT